jgi:hypothetical protein
MRVNALPDSHTISAYVRYKAMKPAKPPAGPFWCKEKLKEKLKFTTITVPVHTGTTGSTFERNTSAMLLPMKHE